jgi:FAD/FMN-containing dehydrogenase
LKENQCHFAIKSGGHARYPGASNANGGVTIDLRRMNTVEIAENGMSAQVCAGSRWRDVYQILEAQGLAVVGGSVADVGVGGLTLGGMYIFGIHLVHSHVV